MYAEVLDKKLGDFSPMRRYYLRLMLIEDFGEQTCGAVSKDNI